VKESTTAGNGPEQVPGETRHLLPKLDRSGDNPNAVAALSPGIPAAAFTETPEINPGPVWPGGASSTHHTYSGWWSFARAVDRPRRGEKTRDL